MTSLPLVFDAPKRALPPRHLADLDPADRRAAVGELGLPGFRADQLAHHYFGRLTADLDAMTDLPAAAREGLAGLLPPLVTPVTEQTCDGGTTRKTLWRGARRHARRVGAHGLSGPRHGVHLQPGRLRDGVPVLRHRPGRAAAQPVDRARSSTRCARPPPRPATARWASRRGCPTSCSWAWASRWPTTSAWSRRCAGSPSPPRTASGSPRAGSPSRRSGSSPRSTS